MICWKGGNEDFSEKSMVVGLSSNYTTQRLGDGICLQVKTLHIR